jgi:hypothetical protein
MPQADAETQGTPHSSHAIKRARLTPSRSRPDSKSGMLSLFFSLSLTNAFEILWINDWLCACVFFFYGLLLLLLPAARGGQSPAKPDPPDPSHRLPVREISYGRIQIILLLFFFFSGFGWSTDFMILVGYPPDPPDHSLILLKKKKSNIYYTVYPTVPTPPEPFFLSLNLTMLT